LGVLGWLGHFCADVCADAPRFLLYGLPRRISRMAFPLELQLTRRSLSRFAQAVQPSYELDAFHKKLIDTVADLLSGRIKRLALVTPPQHGKSEVATVLAPAFALGRNPRENVISVSYGAELAEGFGRRVRDLIASPRFREIFPGCQISPDSSAVYHFQTTEQGTYSATGRGGPITGRPCSLMVLDDLIKDNVEGASDATCRSTIEWMQSVCLTRMKPDGRILAIGTRWGAKDPLAWLISQPGWTVLHLPAICTSHDDPLDRRIGEALWPSRFPIEVLEAKRAEVGSKVFQLLYQGDVAASAGRIFRRDWMRTYTTLPERFDRKIQAWDSAYKTTEAADYSVCSTWGVSDKGIYLLHVLREKLEFPNLLRAMKDLAEAWHPDEIIVEDRASGQSAVQSLQQSTTYPVIPIRPDRDKESRALAAAAYFEAGRVFFPAGAPWLADFQDELASFPNASLHDDGVDSTTLALNRLKSKPGLTWVEWIKKKALPQPRTAIPPKQLDAPPKHVVQCCPVRYLQRTPVGDRCGNCGAPWTLPAVLIIDGPCCNNIPLHGLVGGGMTLCRQHAAQWWGEGSNPHPPTRFTRADLEKFRGRFPSR
jgi:predicted phage terminase large subunit-like protein